MFPNFKPPLGYHFSVRDFQKRGCLFTLRPLCPNTENEIVNHSPAANLGTSNNSKEGTEIANIPSPFP